MGSGEGKSRRDWASSDLLVWVPSAVGVSAVLLPRDLGWGFLVLVDGLKAAIDFRLEGFNQRQVEAWLGLVRLLEG